MRIHAHSMDAVDLLPRLVAFRAIIPAVLLLRHTAF